MSNRLNILHIFTDQQRFDTIAALGNPIIRTPNLDRLVHEGTAFTNCYSPCPVSVPARCSMAYGQYPWRTGCYENRYPFPDDGRPTFMQVLTEAGYETHGIGKCHFPGKPGQLWGFGARTTQEETIPPEHDDYRRFLCEEGYEQVIDPHGVRSEMYYIPQVSQLPARLHPTQWIGDRCEAFIRERRGSADPWMLYASFIHPHPPFAPPSPWHKLYRAPDMPLPLMPPDVESLHTHINRHQNRYKYRDAGLDLNLIRCMRAHYYACISFIDLQVGRLLDVLHETGQLDNTLILFASDHGEHLGDYGCFGKRSFHDTAARVPLLVRLPGRFGGGRRCDAMTSLVDVAPTFLNAAMGRCALETDGLDLSDVAAGRTDRSVVFSQYERGPLTIAAAITEGHKYAWSAADGVEFLFDRRQDPYETRNRAGCRHHEPQIEPVRKHLMDTLRASGQDDLIDGDTWRSFPPAPRDKQMRDCPDACLLIQDPRGWKLDLPGYTDPDN